MKLVSPRAIPLFTDNAMCLETIERLRWAEGHYCPRCGSRDVHKMKSNIFREAHRCAACGYLHNALSGTVFMGARLPLPRYFQFFTILDALGDSLTFRDIAFVVGVAHKTAKGFAARLEAAKIDAKFTRIDRDLSDRLRDGYRGTEAGDGENFFTYCEIKSITVDEAEFMRYVQRLCTTTVPPFTRGPQDRT